MNKPYSMHKSLILKISYGHNQVSVKKCWIFWNAARNHIRIWRRSCTCIRHSCSQPQHFHFLCGCGYRRFQQWVFIPLVPEFLPHFRRALRIINASQWLSSLFLTNTARSGFLFSHSKVETISPFNLLFTFHLHRRPNITDFPSNRADWFSWFWYV